MCGRFSFDWLVSQIQDHYDIVESEWEPEPNYNVAPTQDVPALVFRDKGNVLEKMTWGLIPFWAKDRKIGSKMINARIETVGGKPAFKRPLKKHRCLVLASGFFEWAKTPRRKVPMYIHFKDNRPFGFAGLYDNWKSPEGEVFKSCTIITTNSNELLRPIHHRMPLILTKSQEKDWLDPNTPDMADWLSSLPSIPQREMEAYEISSLVNFTENNGPEIIKPLKKQPSLEDFGLGM